MTRPTGKHSSDRVGFRRQPLSRQQNELAAVRRLYELSTRPVTSDNLEEVLAEILDTAITLSGADMGSIQLFNEQTGTLQLKAHRGLPDAVLDFFTDVRPAPGACGTASGAAYARRQRVVVEDVNTSPIFAGTPAREILLAANALAQHSTPLVSRDGRLVGMLSTHYRQPIRAADLDLHLIDLLAAQTANIIVQVRTDQALRDREAEYRLLTESMDEGFEICRLIRDAVGRPVDFEVLEANPAWTKQTGIPRDQAIGHRASEFLSIVEPAWLQHYDEVIRTGKPLRFEHDNRDLGRVYSIFAYPLGKPDHFGCVFRDITKKRRKEKELRRRQGDLERLVAERTAELRRSERHYRTLLENVPLVIARYDRQLRYLYRNPHADDFFNLPGSEVVGKTWEEIGVPENICRPWREKLIEALNTVQTVDYEIRFPNKAGEMRTYLAKGVPEIDENGHVESLLGFSVDITEHKRLEAELLRLDRLNTVGEMAAAIGHEVRNPLTTVRGYLQMFLRKPESAKYREQFATMIEELDRANVIITDFLSLAKNKVVKLQTYNLNDVISALLPLLQAEALHTGHELAIGMDEIADFPMDEKEIRQLLLNLAHNALEAMDPGGKMTIATEAVSGGVILRVSDNGPGIPSEILEKLGTPFLTTKENGTGLGLAVCCRIVDRHGAKLDIKTSTAGTTFSIYFKTS